ncbi:hypothetical protein L5D93_29510 [Paenibacillus thiaminolyticus]|nr:hypothetical protein [Paenibacillus thiaminolyticus]
MQTKRPLQGYRPAVHPLDACDICSWRASSSVQGAQRSAKRPACAIRLLCRAAAIHQQTGSGNEGEEPSLGPGQEHIKSTPGAYQEHTRSTGRLSFFRRLKEAQQPFQQ